MAKRIGVDWINNYHGNFGLQDLKNRDNCAEGFYNTLSGIKCFDWGNDYAWDTDFEEQGAGSPPAGSDVLYADNVDIVYFSGHGWLSFGVNTHDDGSSGPGEMRLGNGKCRYLIVDSCESMSDRGTARWQPIFKGLRAMFAFVTEAHDEGDRGGKFANYLNAGHWMDDAWKWACQETEGGECEWGYIHTLSPSNSWNDKWTDPTDPAVLNPTLHFHSGSC